MKTMKTSLYLFACLFAGSLTLNAQKNFQAGVKGEFSWVSMPGIILEAGMKKESKTSLGYGVYGEYFLNDASQLHLDIMYSEAGAKLSEGNMTYDFKHNFLNLPLTLRYFFSKDRGGFYIEGGPQMGFLLNNSLRLSNGSNEETMNTDEFFKMGGIDLTTNKSIFSAVAGIGVSSGLISIGIRYTSSFSNAFTGTEMEFKDAKYAAIQAQFAMRF